MPGTSPAEAMRVVAGELPDLPHLPELPARGPGADITGRTAGLLVDIPVEVSPRGWRIAEHPGRDLARARTMLSSDLDVMEEVLDGYRGLFKVQLCGPWTLAATLELPRTLNVAIADPGAVADLTASLAEGAAAHVAELAKRLPGATIAVQFDEPALPAVAGGEVPTASGLSRLRPVEAEVLRERLAQVLAAVQGYTVVHSCATSVPFGLIRTAAANALSFDLSRLRRGEEDAIAEAAEAGLGLLIGAVPAVPAPAATTGVPGGAAPAARPVGAVAPGDGSAEARQTGERIIRLWRHLGLPLASCPEQVVITPACGLAGASPSQARAALTRCREAASMLAELIEETGES
jgi:methionine synthase II (cobalamin-independent)